MGSWNDPKIDQVDPTNPRVVGSVNAANVFSQNILNNPQAFAAFLQSFGPGMEGLRNAANANPEQATFDRISPLLMGKANRTFTNKFTELTNPFGDMGSVNQAQQQLLATSPIFARQHQDALARVNAAAPGRFSSALAQEGRDVTTEALQNFNAFAQNAIMQGLELQNRERQAALNFALGARQTQQGAENDVMQALLGADSNAINALLGLGNQAGMVGMNNFNRQLGLTNAGLQQQQNVLNPLIQLILGGLGFGQAGNQPMDTVVGPSTWQNIASLGQAGAAAYGLTRGRR